MADEEELLDFYGLRKRLTEEYAFINRQKQEIQNEYSAIVSTGDSLFRSLWINGQQWQNLQRLKGGPKFSSECVYAGNLLDSISFVDGYMRVGFKEVKYGNFLRALKDDIALVKAILILADEMNLDTSAFVRTVLISLYGSCLFPADQMAVLRIARCIIEYHLVFSETPLAIFNSERNSFINILEIILQTSYPARGFLVSACKESIMNILLDGSMFWTLEEQELLSVMAVSKVRQKFGDPGSPGTTERIRTYMKESWSKLIETVNTILKKVEESLDCLPDIFLLVVSYFYSFSIKRGFTEHQAKINVLHFLFSQVITPSLLRPQPLLLDVEVRASNIALFNLRKVVEILKILISLESGDGLLYLSEEAKTFYEKLDRAPLYEVVDSLLKKVPADAESFLQDEDQFPGIARSSVLITKKDLDSLISLLIQLQHVADLPNEATKKQEQRLIDQKSLQNILSHLEGINQDVTNNFAKLSLQTQTRQQIQNNLQNIFQSFTETFVENEEVLVISLGITTVDCPGMLPEEKILGIPTPKAKRKTTSSIIPDDSFDTSQLSDSDSNESSSDDKPLDLKPQAEETIEAGEDVVIGFEDSFVSLPNDSSFPQDTGLQTVDPFKNFNSSSTSVIDQNDPFCNVVPAPWKPPTPPPPPPPPREQNQTDLLVDLSDPVSSSPIPPLPHASPTITSKRHANEMFRNSYSSQSSSSSGRHSSTASSGSDGTFIQSHHRIQQGNPTPGKEKTKVLRKSSLKNLQNVISSQLGNQRKEKKKKSIRSPRKPFEKKGQEALLDANRVATIIAASGDQEKTAKDICDEIISKYVKVKRVRSVSSLPDKPDTEQVSSADDTSASFDEDELVKDAKNKLRCVLSSGSKPVLPFHLNEHNRVTKSEDSGSALFSYLKRDLADAVAIQNPVMIAKLHETLGAVSNLPSSSHPLLLKQLEQEYYERRCYTSYLVRSYQGLMSTRAFLENMLKRVERDREICRRFLMTQSVSLYMEKYKEKLEMFVRKFQRLSMSDEKSEEMKAFLQQWKEQFQNDSLWLGSNEKQRCELMDAVERFVIGRVYLNALYAFGETDKFRDDVFHDNVELMCKSIGDNFTALDIKEEYQREAPWFPAQYELLTLAAYKTPVDKLKCIQRCCTTIMTLLGMSSGAGAVGADAFTPVLIYVVMHANPRGLLTTVDFINSYLQEPLTGEQYYCWMQFCSAIQFIKILLEENNSK